MTLKSSKMFEKWPKIGSKISWKRPTNDQKWLERSMKSGPKLVGTPCIWWWDAFASAKNALFCPSRPSEKDWKNGVHLLLCGRENNLLSIRMRQSIIIPQSLKITQKVSFYNLRKNSKSKTCPKLKKWNVTVDELSVEVKTSFVNKTLAKSTHFIA